MKVTARTSDELLEALDRNEAARRVGESEMLDLLSRLEEMWPDDLCIPDLASELASRWGISAYTAGERIRVTVALSELPALRAAQARGLISWDQLRWLTKFVTPETDVDWATRGAGLPPWRLRLEAERQHRLRRQEADSDHADRRLSMGWDEERRNLDVHVSYAREQGVEVEAALKAAAEQTPADPDAYDPAGARLADALHGLVTSSGRRSQSATLVVHTDAELVAGVSDGRRRLAETSSGVQLTAESVRRLACDARVLWSFERDGKPVALASKSRSRSSHQMETLLFRDRGCTFPGCGSTWFLHAHHIQHWADGGKTTNENLTLLCGGHHRRVHDGGWTIRGTPGRLEFVSRSGYVMGRASPLSARAG